jgi:hypothetical protein
VAHLQPASLPEKLALTILSVLFASVYRLALQWAGVLAKPDPGEAAVWREITYGLPVDCLT